MIVGFTGTRHGMTDRQKDGLRLRLAKAIGGLNIFHHGDCIGADAEAHDIAKELGYSICIHPPAYDKARAFKQGDVVLPVESYVVRNHKIVDSCQILIAAPHTSGEGIWSGTWATIRYAYKTHCATIILKP